MRHVAKAVQARRSMNWRWQRRFARQGPEDLLRNKTRKPSNPLIQAEAAERVVALTCMGFAGRSPRRPVYRCVLHSATVTHVGFGHTGCEPSSARAIRSSPRIWPISSGSARAAYVVADVTKLDLPVDPVGSEH